MFKHESEQHFFRIITYNSFFIQLTKLTMEFLMKLPEESLPALQGNYDSNAFRCAYKTACNVVGKSIHRKLGSVVTAAATTMALVALLIANPAFISRAVAAGDVTEVPSGLYTLDPTHAYLQFQYNHLGLSNPILSFDDFSINLKLDNENPIKSDIEVEIDVDSIQTGSSIWHQHLVGSDWFDTGTHPTITFKSTEIYGGGAVYIVTGDLIIKGKSQPATLEVTINAATTHPFENKPVIGISAVGSLLRSDWGLGKNVPFVSDKVEIKIEAELFNG